MNLHKLAALVADCAHHSYYEGECAEVWEQAQACAEKHAIDKLVRSIMRAGYLRGYAACYERFGPKQESEVTT